MNYSATDPYFPENLDDFAPWVAEHGLVAPYGKCQCGCGENTTITQKSYYSAGRKMGHPARFVQGHNARRADDAPDGFKTCSFCGQVKTVSEYYVLNGGELNSTCKLCACEVSRRYHHSNRDERLERIASYRQENRAALNEKSRQRSADPEYRKRKAEILKNWRERNREHIRAYNRSNRVKARSAVNHAIRDGKLPPPSSTMCNCCEAKLAAHYHHYNGYEVAHWFDVVALCTECHGREHWSES